MAEVLFDWMGQAAGVRLKIPGYPPGSKAASIAVGPPNYVLRAFVVNLYRNFCRPEPKNEKS
jgi:hypothetical protein